MSVIPQRAIPTVLLPEILGFSPQLLLDDVINIANDAVNVAVNAMEEFLQRWAEEYSKTAGEDWDSTQEVENGLVSFQTLLESHTDIAFDFFEAWSLRNIFAFSPELPMVTRHHEGLNLEESPQHEMELMAEIEELRRKIDEVCDSFSIRYIFNASYLFFSNVV
jgi:kinetochore protein Mis12/MTW1